MGLGPNWYQVDSKTCYIPEVSIFYVEKWYLCQQAWKFYCHLWHVNLYFTEQNKVQRDPLELNFEGLEMLKLNNPTDGAQGLDEENLVICLVIMFTLRIKVIEMSQTA